MGISALGLLRKEHSETVDLGRLAAKTARRPGSPGFTLLELVIAMGVTAFTVLALMGFLLFLGRTSAATDAAAAALFCAERKIEELRARAVEGSFSGEGEEMLESAGGPGMERRWSVRPELHQPALLTVRVECVRLAAGGEVRKTLETLVCAGE